MELILPKLILPDHEALLEFGGITEYGKRWLDKYEETMERPMAGGASYSNYAEGKILDHSTGKTSWTAPSFYLALCTVVPTDADTGTSITEATYTGYARLNVAGASWVAASAGETHNSGTLTFGACTAGSSTVLGWAGCDASTVGNMIVWGTTTSTAISTTATPPTIAASGLSVTLD